MTDAKGEGGASVDDRGEITLPLEEGAAYRLRPSYAAIKAIEAKTGRSLLDLASAARSQSLSIGEAAIVAAEMMRAYAASNPDDPLKSSYAGASAERLAELIYEAGSVRIQPRLAVVLFGAVTGGYDASGEVKPAKANPPPSAG